MKQIPDSQIGLTSLLIHILAIPAFFLCFVLLYQSEWMIDFLGMGKDKVVFNTLILMCIIIGVLCSSRIPMTACRKHIHLPWVYYILWGLAEMVVMALFMALYMTLMYHGQYGYFLVAGKCMLILLATITYPYTIINLLMYATRTQPVMPQEDDLIRFCDSTQRLKLVIAADAILYIQADENYVNIHYIEGGNCKEYALRNSMRSIEELLQKHGVVRCQRSFFVNPKHVKVLRRDKEGVIVAELDFADTKPIPVSPKYYQELNQRL